jgi:TonB family protein
MRRCTAVVLLVLSILVASTSQAQQSEAKRKVTSRFVPAYPELARKMQLRGVVRIQVLVSPNGKVKSTEVLGGSPLLAKSAVDAVEKWKWEPAAQESKELIELNFDPLK